MITVASPCAVVLFIWYLDDLFVVFHLDSSPLTACSLSAGPVYAGCPTLLVHSS